MAIETTPVTEEAPREPNRAGIYDEEATASLKRFFEENMRESGQGDFSAMRRGVAPEATAYDYDFANRPMIVNGEQDWQRYVDTLEAGLADARDIEMKLIRTDAYATKELGFVTCEFDLSFTLEEQRAGPLHWRGTMVCRREGDQWLMVHWHASPQHALGFSAAAH